MVVIAAAHDADAACTSDVDIIVCEAIVRAVATPSVGDMSSAELWMFKAWAANLFWRTSDRPILETKRRGSSIVRSMTRSEHTCLDNCPASIVGGRPLSDASTCAVCNTSNTFNFAPRRERRASLSRAVGSLLGRPRLTC